MNNQHGFRKGFSTISAIVTLLNGIYQEVNSKRDSYLIFLDLKKAFDTVSHNILLNKLGSIGLDGKTVPWFNSYLLDRKQVVKINNTTSGMKDILYGVPQGSV